MIFWQILWSLPDGLYFTYEELKPIKGGYLGANIRSLYFTYEELKHGGREYLVDDDANGLYFTYEELKLEPERRKMQFADIVCILPMRN